jgi:hypothetical protein
MTLRPPVPCPILNLLQSFPLKLQAYVGKLLGQLGRTEFRNGKETPGARWVQTDTLIIDEISMLSASLFSKLDEIGRHMRNRGENKHLPFGGLQVIVTGDFFQLPPGAVFPSCTLHQTHIIASYHACVAVQLTVVHPPVLRSAGHARSTEASRGGVRRCQVGKERCCTGLWHEVVTADKICV